MHKSLKRAAFAIGAAATIAALGAATAAAAPTFTAKIGSAASGSGTYTAASVGSVKLTDTTTGIVITCTSASAAGSVPVLGSGQSGNSIVKIASTGWISCTGVGLTFTVTQTSTPWLVNAVSTTAGGVTTGNLTGIAAHLAATGCTFDVTGATDGTYTNSSQILAVNPVAGSGHTLAISNVVGCFGAVGNGHTASFVGSYKVAATAGGVAGALTITSP
ncbi:MAG: hypothetical protein M3Y42_12645 [Actinomycetota bacterium]|nr:hypothetical protein [Actinomycetota bacterium]MDQ2957802.1 hypothetical protein [Actinomycetota bacterium]